jgi:hypothetical protein
VTIFVLTFDRKTRAVDVAPIDDPDEAMERLLEAEERRRDHPELEVVLLTARDEDDLRKTHSRFFESLDELLEPA